MSFELLDLTSSNALGFWEDRGDACEAVLELLWTDPEARDEVVLVEFDSAGMAVRRIYPPEVGK